MFGWFQHDWHTLIHLLGCYVLMDVISLVPIKRRFVAIIVLVLGFGWELMDEFAKHAMLDSRGGDWRDLLVDTCGIILYLLISEIHRRRICKDS